MSFEAFIGIAATLCAGSIWVVNILIDNRVLKQKVHDLEKENERLIDYAKISKP